ncbi:hypothetical protein VNI00_008205 [Paramarasmius palmivorus]|uniref:DH domain-containing protein n=1 Tax=Paramarasmius palmivorus TaxID=297713 RepID=A0AAW0CXQ3_9AGAR
MKAFFSRLHLGGTKPDKDKDLPASQPKEKFPPLRSWPPASSQDPDFSNRNSSLKPLPDIIQDRPLPAIVPTESLAAAIGPIQRSSSEPSPTSPTIQSKSPPPPKSPTLREDDRDTLQDLRTTSPQPQPDSTGRSSRKTNGSTQSNNNATDIQKKVAFISPSPTFDEPPPGSPTLSASPAAVAPLKTNVSRFQATHKEPRGSTSSAGTAGASSSKTDLGSTKNGVGGGKASSMRTASPYAQSVRSGTPYSQMSNTTSGSRILAATSWSEVTEEDLVSNLGSRERTRQEVLFEIISSEDRYVQELAKMKDTFIDPLLHPYSSSGTASPISSTPNLDYREDFYRSESPSESTDQLPPIAARFMSPTPSIPSRTQNIDGESMETDEDDFDDDTPPKDYPSRKGATSQASKHNHPRSPYRSNRGNGNGKPSPVVPFPSRSHHSLPPPPRANFNASTQSLGRQSTAVEHSTQSHHRERNYSQGQSTVSKEKGMLRKLKKSDTKGPAVLRDTVAPQQLPEDLRICLEVIDSGVFDGHKRLSEALKKRYDEQFPLVRSLADVFVANSDIFQGYAKYVLHLERALEQVDAALSNVSTKKPKNQDMAEWQKVCNVLQRLEETAGEKGETGLAITLSKPFQRLLKYPLLFQNLLFHTDPSTFEYESTLQMVAEVESIVRSIEDEKIQKEERDKTRDAFARIEGLDKVRQVAAPKPSRVLIRERQCPPAVGSPGKGSSPQGVRGKSSFKKLSDVLSTGKKDLWFVEFNDVVLLCQRTGTTSLPLVAATSSRTNSLPELQGKSKYATTGRRNSHTKPRNLYKFIKIETWQMIGEGPQPGEGLVSKEDVARSRAQVGKPQPRIVPMPDDDDDDDDCDSDDSDRKSKMSFSYWGADKVTVQKPLIKPRVTTARRVAGPSYGRESSANAKFGTRLVSDGAANGSSPRPVNRKVTSTPTSRLRPITNDEMKATVTRPGWNSNTSTHGTRSPNAASPKIQQQRSRNTSQTSAATRTNGGVAKMSSPVPSEDSGVGLRPQFLV